MCSMLPKIPSMRLYGSVQLAVKHLAVLSYAGTLASKVPCLAQLAQEGPGDMENDVSYWSRNSCRLISNLLFHLHSGVSTRNNLLV